MKNGKAPGSDGIASETWKDRSLQPLLLKIVQYVWEKDEIPNEWNLSHINAIPKKKGFRTVSIINSAAKVYAKVINSLIKDIVKEFVGKNQYGFISKRSAKQEILRIDIKREHFTEHRKKGKLLMIDFSKAFNKISSSAIKEALKEAGVSKKLIWKY